VVEAAGAYVPERGDAIWINLHPQAGHEQAGRRPALVLSPSAYNGRVGLALLCPITNQRKGYPFEVRIPPRLRVTGVVLADQIKSLAWQVRQAEFICALPSATVAEVMAKLRTLLSDQV
jgi:mRNA interferase MazF